ncbi:MAG TPA: hypothetical protein VMK12_06685, partial [Anaeromyxobacteraceae bacterium]|nr:hypothetical protein [Anaeromyxobacteraceae bacterium]
DLLKATDIARSMVKAYGMSEKLGQLSLERERRPMYMDGCGLQGIGDYGAETAREVDSEVRRLLEEQHTRVTTVLGARTELLRQAARVLLEKENLTGVELQAIAAGSSSCLPDASRDPAVVTATGSLQEPVPARAAQA